MDTGKILMLGGLGVGGYLAYRWYAGPGGYKDQQTCAGTQTSDVDLKNLSIQAYVMGAKSNITPEAVIDAIVAKNGDSASLACARVAIAKYPQSAATVAAASAPGAPTTLTAITPQPQQPAPSSAAASTSALDALYAQLKSAVATDTFFSGSGDSRTGSVDHWNYYLQQIVGTPQIPGGMFASVSGMDPNNLTAAQYWMVMAPWVASNKGLSGLGVFGGLGSLAMGWR